MYLLINNIINIKYSIHIQYIHRILTPSKQEFDLATEIMERMFSNEIKESENYVAIIHVEEDRKVVMTMEKEL